MRTGTLVPRAKGDMQDKIGQPTEMGPRALVDPDARVIGLHLYDGMLKVYRPPQLLVHTHHSRPLGPSGCRAHVDACACRHQRVIAGCCGLAAPQVIPLSDKCSVAMAMNMRLEELQVRAAAAGTKCMQLSLWSAPSSMHSSIHVHALQAGHYFRGT